MTKVIREMLVHIGVKVRLNFETLEEKFNEAVKYIDRDSSDLTLTNAQKLQLYALFKQATLGDVQGSRPWAERVRTARTKWDAWNAQKGKSKEQAMQEYVDEIERQVWCIDATT